MSRNELGWWIRAFFLGASCSALAIEVEVATGKSSYYEGEQVDVLVTVTNPATLSFSSSLQTSYTLDDDYTPPWIGLTVLTSATTPRTWTNTHSWQDYPLALGMHRVVGTVVGYGTSAAASFAVVRFPAPTGDFLIDFDTLPGTTSRVAHLMVYEACGVRFHTRQGKACGLAGDGTNAYVAGFDPYPVGFHVIADFARPVFGARAKVAGGTGAQITMIARNAQGRTLASAASGPITLPGEFVQTLSVTTAEPIASLEWMPSVPNSLAGVDDLFVITDPVLNQTLVGNTLRLTWPTVSGANYQLWSSTNLATWTPFGSLHAGTGSVLTNDTPLTGASPRFFRVSKAD